MLVRLLILLALTATTPPLHGADAIDPALVGTWKLDWPRPDLYWAVRPDGVYRVHGPGANLRQLGRLQAGQGRFSMQSPVWVDSGTYRFNGPEALVITGQLGPGSWKRVWKPGRSGGEPAPGPGSCRLFSASEVASLLMAPVTAAPSQHGTGECVYTSQLSPLDSVSVKGFPARREAWYITRKVPNPTFTSVPGVGEDAYVVQSGAGPPTLKILAGPEQFTVSIRLTPEASQEDVPALVELARAGGRRLGR